MRDVLSELETWWREGRPVGMGTVVATWKSSPRQPGTSMLVGPDGAVVGSVSGGCVEGAVYELAIEARDGGGGLLQRYGVSDDDAFAVGLTCGGTIDVFVERVDQQTFAELGELAEDIRGGRPVAVATLIADESGTRQVGRRLVLRGGTISGTLGDVQLDAAAAGGLQGMLEQGRTGIVRYGPEGQRRQDEVSVFIAAYAPRPRMIVFGATDFASAAARVGVFLGYRVTVCDARATFATPTRFPDADEVIVDWPHRYLAKAADAGEIDERTVLCVLTHDPKFDVPLLELALRLPHAYIGAMGSRPTIDDRVAQLRERGLSETELARLHAPIGLDIGARTPEETAVSIAAEILANRSGGTGAHLSRTSGPIHPDSSAPRG